MDFALREILDLNAHCARLANELHECLKEERVALVTLKTADLVETNFRKEALCYQLSKKKKELRAILKRKFGTEKLREVTKMLSKEDAKLFLESVERWEMSWQLLQNLAERNQKLLKHSIKNMGLLVDHFKKLIGLDPTYSSAGRKTQTQGSGRVLAGKY